VKARPFSLPVKRGKYQDADAKQTQDESGKSRTQTLGQYGMSGERR